MLAEFVEKLNAMAYEAKRPDLLALDPNDSRTAYLWNPHSKSVETVALRATAREHTVNSLRSLADAFDRYSVHYQPSVWCDLTGVVVVLDDENLREDGSEHDARENTITLPITASPLFQSLANVPSEQESLVYFLRHTLHGASVSPANLELAVSSLRWQTTDVAVGQFGTLSSKMGKDVTAEVTPGGDVPLEMRVEFLPFPALVDGLDEPVAVTCSVHVMPAKRQILIKPFPGQMEMAVVKATAALVEHVTALLKVEAGVVFAGSP